MARSTDLKPMIFVPTPTDKRVATTICGKFIDSVEEYPLEFKVFVLQMLLESFEEHYDVDIRGGYSVHKK